MSASGQSNETRLELPPADFVASLSSEERMLLRLRDELYEGCWDNLRADLENRLRGKPYIFKLVCRIEHDLQAAELLAAYEKKHGVDLADFARDALY